LPEVPVLTFAKFYQILSEAGRELILGTIRPARWKKGKIDVLFASAGTGEAVKLSEITEQHFDAAFGLNVRGTLFTVQKALPLFNDGGSIFMTGSMAPVKGFPGFSVYSASKAALRSFARTWLNELKGRNIQVNVLRPRKLRRSRCFLLQTIRAS